MGLRLVTSKRGGFRISGRGFINIKVLGGRFADYLLIHLLMLPTLKKLKGLWACPSFRPNKN